MKPNIANTKEVNIGQLRSKFIDILIEEIPSSKKYKGYVAEMISDDILMLYKEGEEIHYYSVGKIADKMVRRYIEDGETVFPIKV